MLRTHPISIFACAGTLAASLCFSAPIALSGSLKPMEDQTQYLPIQSFSHDFGSKFMSGYFTQQADACSVVLMVIERTDPETTLAQSGTRVRLLLYPGQIAGLDSEEGHSVNFTCGEDAATMLVNVGERDKLVAQQSLALPNDVAESR